LISRKNEKEESDPSARAKRNTTNHSHLSLKLLWNWERIFELNACKPSTSTIEHVTICSRCRDINVDAIHDHLALIKKQNDHIAQLSAKIN
jgi:hypothetical protein